MPFLSPEGRGKSFPLPSPEEGNTPREPPRRGKGRRGGKEYFVERSIHDFGGRGAFALVSFGKGGKRGEKKGKGEGPGQGEKDHMLCSRAEKAQKGKERGIDSRFRLILAFSFY